MSFSKYSVLYTSETNKPASVFSTLASLFFVSPFMALSHFLLLSPVCHFSSFRSMGELSLFFDLKNNCSCIEGMVGGYAKDSEKVVQKA